MQILKTRELQHNCMIYIEKHMRHDICIDTSGVSIGNSSDNQVTAVTYSNSSDIMTIESRKNSWTRLDWAENLAIMYITQTDRLNITKHNTETANSTKKPEAATLRCWKHDQAGWQLDRKMQQLHSVHYKLNTSLKEMIQATQASSVCTLCHSDEFTLKCL